MVGPTGLCDLVAVSGTPLNGLQLWRCSMVSSKFPEGKFSARSVVGCFRRWWPTDTPSNSCSCSVGCFRGVCMRCLTAWATRAAGRPLSWICRDAPVDVLARSGDLVHRAGTHRAGDDRARRTNFGKHFSSAIGCLDRDGVRAAPTTSAPGGTAQHARSKKTVLPVTVVWRSSWAPGVPESVRL